MSTIPKSAELRAMAQLLNIDFSTVNFRSSTQRQSLYNQIQAAKASVVPVEPTEELEALRIENARLRLENQELKNQLNSLDKRLAKLEGEIHVREHVGKSLEAQLSEYRSIPKVIEKFYGQDLIDRLSKQTERTKEITNEIIEVLKEIDE